MAKTLSWQDELEIIDRTMRAISRVTDPEALVEIYWGGIGELLPNREYLALSRRGVQPPHYLITRSSRFTEHPNPWTERERLPLLSGGLLGEILYAQRPVVIDDLASRLATEDPAYEYLEGYGSLVGTPQYDGGEALNFALMLFAPGEAMERERIPMLHWQSSLFGRGTQNLVLRNQLADALSALDAELKVVGEIQRSLLPSELPEIPGFDIAAYYQTSARAGGDYYDFFRLDGGRWGLLIADVSGHGAPAAVLMAIMRAIAHARPAVHRSPVELLACLNEQLVGSYAHAGAFVTAFYAILDPSTCELEYCVAGHNPPRLVSADRVESMGAGGGVPLGVLADERYVSARASIGDGDVLVLYTDGITEAMAPRAVSGTRELFGVGRLDEILERRRGVSARGCIDAVREGVEAFCQGAPPTDDRTLLAIRCGRGHGGER